MTTDKNKKKIKDTFEALGIIAATLGQGTYGKSVDESSTAGSQEGNIFEQKIKEIGKKTRDIENLVSESERRLEKLSQFMTVVAFGALIAFTIATVTVCIDYLNNTKKVDGLNARIEILENKKIKP